ncbi:MAG: hypothetical protein P8107_01590 [Spirochaetia bacterium]
MSTTPTIFKRPQISYTVMGGAPKPRVSKYLFPVSIVILNRGGRLFQHDVFNDLPRKESLEVIFIEGPDIAYDVESLSRRYPNVRFLLLHEKCTAGEKVNIGIEEAMSRLVFIIWNDMKISQSSLASRVLEKILHQNALCTVPILKNKKGDTIPSIQTPGYEKKAFKIIPWNPLRDGMKSLFAFDYCGIYNKEKYRLCGGFDGNITTPFWQKADFGFRCFLWGENIVCNTSLLFHYNYELSFEDNTPDESYKLFYLKNLCVDFRSDRGVLPFRHFFRYMIKSNTGIITSLKEFLNVRKWVILNKYRFRRDAKRLIELWEDPE